MEKDKTSLITSVQTSVTTWLNRRQTNGQHEVSNMDDIDYAVMLAELEFK